MCLEWRRDAVKWLRRSSRGTLGKESLWSDGSNAGAHTAVNIYR